MPGTREGSIKTRNRNLEKTTITIDGEVIHIEKGTYYQHIGGSGGKSSRGGGFEDQHVGKDGLTGKERARVAGHKGGLASRRTKAGRNKLDAE